LPNKHKGGHHKATEVEGDQRSPGKRDLKKEMWIVGSHTVGGRWRHKI